MLRGTVGRMGMAGLLVLACTPEGPVEIEEPKCTELEEGEICLYPRGEEGPDDGASTGGSSADGSSDGSSDDGASSGGSTTAQDGGVDGAVAGAAGEGLGGSPAATESCLKFWGVLRDFRRGDKPEGHVDFERYAGMGEPGLVATELGPDGKPVLAKEDPETIWSAESFSAWYRDTAESAAYDFSARLAETGEGAEFGIGEFFPLDDLGFGNQGKAHNFGFTTEMHGMLRYDGEQDGTFTFIGDDDLWVFIDGRLVIDLGGVHPPRKESFDLSEVGEQLNLEPGGTYSFDLFHAERRSSQSSFRMITTLRFVDCDED